ncbi:AraC family transcriptional regulator [Labrenzia sp. VG12]|uniref:AraC family transcriptional regulator n=1 Tax=Labrenzia sp. VG12 TaxID=2021862 RepID=UPI0018E05513|nr:AraC family transcriptional regulator [Labrenzia sp. VG12]
MPEMEPSLEPDPLADVLHLLRLTGTFYCVPELTAPWGIAVPDLGDQLVLVAVTEGSCLLQLKSGAQFCLRPGQMVLLTHGQPVDLKSYEESTLTPLFDIPATRHTPQFETMVFGGGGDVTRMTCGVLRVDHAAAGHLTGLLPEAIFLDGFEAASGSWVQSTLNYLAEEARHPKPGGETVLTRLTDILVVQAIRSWLENGDVPETGWLAALRDRKIGRALQAFHRAPQESWTIETLAQQAGMSRSAFAARFRQMTGEAVLQYATRWRMQLAHRALKESDRSLAEIAADMGYDSEAAFSRAFKRVLGCTPGAARKA